MNNATLLSDEPAASKADSLFFDRYLKAIERYVLDRHDSSPFVVGIYGRWGTGKSSLMKMVGERLKKDPNRWEVVEFSPWMYRNEKSLLLPLLATLAKKRDAFEKLIKEIVKSGPGLIKALASMSIEMATTGLPLLTFLSSIKDQKEKAKDLGEKIADAVKEVTGGTKKMVFLIDDLDRCHDPIQIIGLLEQIKLFLHLDDCIFFICADKDQIIKAIESKFQGEGENYLDKFVQLPIELYPHHSHHLTDMLDIEDNDLRRYVMRIAEVLGNNPRKLKKLWNRAVVGLSIIREEMQRVQTFVHEPQLKLMLKWLLLSECPPLRENPYLYLKLEDEEYRFEEGRCLDDPQLLNLGLKVEKKGADDQTEFKWRSDMHRRLATFLLTDLKRHRFEKPGIISLYAAACGEDISRSLGAIEEAVCNGITAIESKAYAWADLSDGRFISLSFTGCDFSSAVFRNADLRGVKFRWCSFKGACFDEADINGASWIACEGMNQLNTEPVLYETIADRTVELWREDRRSGGTIKEKNEEYLYKMYRTILELHKDQNTLTTDIERRLVEKGKQVRIEVHGS